MAASVWTDSSILENAGTSPFLGPEPRHSAPPVLQQPSAEVQDEEVVWDESFMEVDDYEEFQSKTSPAPGSASAAQEQETSQSSSARRTRFLTCRCSRDTDPSRSNSPSGS